MNEAVSLVANIVTILGFPISVFVVIRELGKNREEVKKSTNSINNLTESIKNQQIINTDKIENVNINNRET
jgi:hypothetical protein